MKRKKNRGFSLVEVCIAIGLIGIMISLGGLKLRDHVAIAKNVKAASMLKSIRTASEMYYSEKGEPAFSGNTADDAIKNGLKKLKPYLDEKTYAAVSDGRIPIGGGIKCDDENEIKNGIKDEDKIFGGHGILVIDLDKDSKKTEGINIWIHHANSENNSRTNRDLKGVEWKKY